MNTEKKIVFVTSAAEVLHKGNYLTNDWDVSYRFYPTPEHAKNGHWYGITYKGTKVIHWYNPRVGMQWGKMAISEFNALFPA